jgi:hypothetical protein
MEDEKRPLMLQDMLLDDVNQFYGSITMNFALKFNTTMDGIPGMTRSLLVLPATAVQCRQTNVACLLRPTHLRAPLLCPTFPEDDGQRPHAIFHALVSPHSFQNRLFLVLFYMMTVCLGKRTVSIAMYWAG